MNIEHIWRDWPGAEAFSGVFSVNNEHGVIFERCRGFRNRGENLPNNIKTAFGIASGTKLFTGLAVLRLMDDGSLSPDDKLCDVLPFNLGQIDKNITIFQLLTHTSGVGDYIDEESENSMEQLRALYDKHPVYLWDRIEYYLPMITALPSKFKPSARYGYSNAGYILLGAVVEAISGVSYQQFVTDTIINPCKLTHTGFYRTDCLPANTAQGYIRDKKTGEWRSNIFSLPVLGGSDGGLFTCAADLSKLWSAIFSNNILSEETTRLFLTPHVLIGGKDQEESCGFGVFIRKSDNRSMFYAVGGDFGVDFFTAYFPDRKITASALGNTELNTFPLLEALALDLFNE